MLSSSLPWFRPRSRLSISSSGQSKKRTNVGSIPVTFSNAARFFLIARKTINKKFVIAIFQHCSLQQLNCYLRWNNFSFFNHILNHCTIFRTGFNFCSQKIPSTEVSIPKMFDNVRTLSTLSAAWPT
uniref:Uncharacterized protein n=1 Tax=Lotus japonicus TaxID=34305 RepID=I3S8W0_LOTJA|nr:unknown [Lotus japonicus]